MTPQLSDLNKLAKAELLGMRESEGIAQHYSKCSKDLKGSQRYRSAQNPTRCCRMRKVKQRWKASLTPQDRQQLSSIVFPLSFHVFTGLSCPLSTVTNRHRDSGRAKSTSNAVGQSFLKNREIQKRFGTVQ